MSHTTIKAKYQIRLKVGPGQATKNQEELSKGFFKWDKKRLTDLTFTTDKKDSTIIWTFITTPSTMQRIQGRSFTYRKGAKFLLEGRRGSVSRKAANAYAKSKKTDKPTDDQWETVKSLYLEEPEIRFIKQIK